jgi:hypothetical protein
VLFTADAHPGLIDGTITVTFRNWTRPQAKVGGSYRLPRTDITLVVDDLRQLPAADISDADARRAGEADRHGVWRRLGGRRQVGPPDLVVWRIEFHRHVPEPGTVALPLQDDLSPDDVAELDRRLDRLDAASRTHGPWTRPTLRLIAERPAVVSSQLAEALGRDRPSFKLDVRKLKRLGLTESLEVGYRLSPRGQAYLEKVNPR